MLCFCYSKLYHSIWQSLGPSIFCSLFLLLSVSVLFPLFPFLFHLRKSQAPLGHNLWASCTTSPALLLPLWTYPCLALLPQCLLSASGPDQVCSCSRASACGALPTWRLFLQWLHDLFPHPQVSSSITGQISPDSWAHLSKHSSSILPPWPSVFFPCFIFSQSASSCGVTVFHSLLGDEELQESESCAVCCCVPGLGEGPAFGRYYTMFVRMMARIFHFSGVSKQEYF